MDDFEAQDQLLHEIFKARFGKVWSDDNDGPQLLGDLQKYHAYLVHEKVVPKISLQAVRAYFYGKNLNSKRKSVPKRYKAMQHFYGYLLWLREKRLIRDQIVFGRLLSSLSSYADSVVEADRPFTDGQDFPRGWEGDQDTWQSALLLEGLYQVIRPSARGGTQKPSLGGPSFILEPLAIDPRGKVSEQVLMYSYQAPSQENIYSGSLQKSTWSMFSTLGRKNSNIRTRKSYRSLAVCLKGDPEYASCFTGMLTRSMSEDSGYGKRIMAVPFVAIRSTSPPKDVWDDLKLVGPGLRVIKSGLMLGEVKGADMRFQELHKFCTNVFVDLVEGFSAVKNLGGSDDLAAIMVTSIAEPEEVHSAVKSAFGGNSDFASEWAKLVARSIMRS